MMQHKEGIRLQTPNGNEVIFSAECLEDSKARVDDGTEHEAEEDPRALMAETCGIVRKHWVRA